MGAISATPTTALASLLRDGQKLLASSPAPIEEPKIMCYVSKRMVPKSQTVEVEYSAGKKVWVLAKYIRYGEGAKQAD